MYAIGQVYREGRPETDPLYVSSVKTNIGHAEVSHLVVPRFRIGWTLSKKKVYKLYEDSPISSELGVFRTLLVVTL
jgi:hypothetical protein